MVVLAGTAAVGSEPAAMARPAAGDTLNFRSATGDYACSVTTSPAGTHIQCADPTPGSGGCPDFFGMPQFFTAEVWSDGRTLDMCTGVYDFPGAVHLRPGEFRRTETAVVFADWGGGLTVLNTESLGIVHAGPDGVRTMGLPEGLSSVISSGSSAWAL
ncbi:hypothetical protein [Corynebacterium guangdongense]|uniref:Secreted protein n=2 Tax=Corynebacterium guangdongense TaxID=1783348 RepID=A0ABU1ZWF1_9CORY|nr:hypothetical protein [Corynebacterium guangdongense]MDR7329257.1 hypothetical protein [Corynebacterium guangdongense]